MNAVLQIVILIFSAILHEVAHGYVAYSLGDPTAKYAGRLTLNPLAHLDITGSIVLPILLYLSTAGQFVFGWAKPVPYNPYNLRPGRFSEAIVASAGPLSNLAIALVGGLATRSGILSPGASEIVFLIVLVNVMLFVFNLIPIPPLDGSKLLFAFLPNSMENVKIMLERFGFVLVLIFVFYFSHFISPVVEYFMNLFTGGMGLY